jgi:ParB family chromosome partitioning protein
VAERPRGMGRGLAAILAVSDDAAMTEELRSLPTELIVPNPRQPRQDFAEQSLVELAESIRARGILQPVLVRPVAGGTYELIAGERRWRAAGLAGLDQIPALVRAHDDSASLEVALIENMAREDLNPVEEARACAALTEELGLSREEVGRRVGRSRVAVSNLVRLLDLPDDALDLIAGGELTEGHGRALLTASGNDDRRRLARDAVAGGWSVRELEARARGARPRVRSVRHRSTPTLHPDQEDAIVQINDSLTAALGRDLEVTATAGGYRAHLTFESLDDALELARRLSRAPEP